MKKLLSVLTVLMLFMLMGCQESRDAVLPIENPSYLAIYNSGEMIYEAFDTDGKIDITAEKFQNITVSWSDNTTEYWLVYSITQNGVTTKIVDSDALCLVWID